MVDPTDSHAAAAKRLLLQEIARDAAVDWPNAARRVYDVLWRSLSPVIGDAGVRSVLARSVKLSQNKSPCLARVRVASEPHDADAEVIQELVAALGTLDREGSFETASAVYATFFALLTMLIGERLTWRILTRAFGDNERATLKERR